MVTQNQRRINTPDDIEGKQWTPVSITDEPKMSKPHKHPFAMTLRLDQQMADEIENIAFTLNLSRAAFVRRSIRRALQHAHEHELPLLSKRVLEAISP